MDARFATMLGYTQEELEANFADRIEATAGERTIDEYLAKIKKWYNGYRFEENSKTVYNPVSLSKFFENGGKFNNYWFSTGTPSFLMELTKKQNFDFRAALKNKLPQISFSTFEVDNMDPLTLLFQTGYITIKEAMPYLGETWYRMDFPNFEVASAFSNYVLNSYSGKTQTSSKQFVAEIIESLNENNLERMRYALEVFFAGIPYDVHQKRESTFQAIFFALFRLLGQYIEAESTTHNGRIDAVIQTQNDIYLFEFKLDNDPTALEQIKAKEYFKKYLLDKRSIHIVGVNFDAQHGNLVGWQTEDL